MLCTETLVQHLTVFTLDLSISPLLSFCSPKTSSRFFFLLKESLLFAVLLFGGFGSGIPSFANRLLITNLLEKCLTGNSVTLQMVSVPSGHLLDLFLTL